MRIWFLFALLFSGQALAHKASDSFLWLDQNTVGENRLTGRWDVSIRDLDTALGLDADADGAITWRELSAMENSVSAYLLSSLRLSSGGDCTLSPAPLLVDDHAGDTYASLAFAADCPGNVNDLTVAYALMFDIDPGHRGLLRVQLADSKHTAVLAPDNSTWTRPSSDSFLASGFSDFVKQGIWHIWIGYDHVAFLILLLLPSVLRREGKTWQAVGTLPEAMLDMARVVTAFTLAHSITLTVAALGLVNLPSQPVEMAIAASVVFAGLHNLFPTRMGPRWVLAFAFGLIHGFGFASVLSELAGPQNQLLAELVGFNLGVEVGQLAIALALLPAIYLLRSTRFYRHALLPVGSLAIAALAGFWFFERAMI